MCAQTVEIKLETTENCKSLLVPFIRVVNMLAGISGDGTLEIPTLPDFLNLLSLYSDYLVASTLVGKPNSCLSVDSDVVLVHVSL